MKRELYWADLVPRSGSEQTGRRPGRFDHSGPVWTSASEGRRPTAVPIPPGASGLSKTSLALCHQVSNLDRAKLTRRIGSLLCDVWSTFSVPSFLPFEFLGDEADSTREPTV
jgi:mRNA-degrading endonuclease toxin of MazEF toxin-antitoxin module